VDNKQTISSVFANLANTLKQQYNMRALVYILLPTLLLFAVSAEGQTTREFALKKAGVNVAASNVRSQINNSDAPLLKSPGSKYSGVLILEDFERGNLGEFPVDWHAKGRTGAEFYVLAEENGNHYLKADAVRAATSIFRKVKFDVHQYPVLEWRWRGRIMPDGSNERKGNLNDSTAGIYVVFPLRFFLPDSLKYLWSRVLPESDEWTNGVGRNKIRVVESGGKNLGKWVIERRNILEDFERRFDKKGTKKNPIGLGLITDGDQTKSLSSGDYDDFRIMTLEAAKKFKPGFVIEAIGPTNPAAEIPEDAMPEPTPEIEVLSGDDEDSL
jgi:hypothetical protein